MARHLRRTVEIALAAAATFVPVSAASAYTAAGDRTFAATILLPQSAPTDEVYVTGATQPVAGGRASSLSATYDKTITDRFGIGIDEGYAWTDRTGASTLRGWQNVDLFAQYLAVLDGDHEFLASIGATRDFGGTGARRVGSPGPGATSAGLYFAKGFGDVGCAALEPLAVAGMAGYQLGDTAARPDQLAGGLVIEYSLPYYASKIAAAPLPDGLRNLTPMVEIAMTTPVRPHGGAATNITIGPGFDYAGAGWEIGVEALVPASRAAGQGLGFTAQLHLALDYLFPDSIGRPIFSRDADGS